MILVTQPKSVEGRKEATFEYKPGGRVFLPKSYLIPPTLAYDFEILAITVTIQDTPYEVLIGQGVAPATMFCEQPEIHFPKKLINESDKIIVKVRNTCEHKRIFNACFIGEP